MIEVCLNVQPFMQPHPVRNLGGDCFACAATAAVRHLFPERPPEFNRVWDWFVPKGESGPNNTWPGMRRALYAAFSDDYEMQIVADIIRPEFTPDQWSHAWFQFVPAGEYARRLEGYLRSGWVALAEINYAGSGPVTPDGKLNTTDHFVLLDGVKTGYEDCFGSDGKRLGAVEREYIHVVCSAKGPYWITAHDLLVKHGAAGWWLVRRRD